MVAVVTIHTGIGRSAIMIPHWGIISYANEPLHLITRSEQRIIPARENILFGATKKTPAVSDKRLLSVFTFRLVF